MSRDRGLGNIEVVTADVAEFEPDASFDRVVSIEMLEHVRNHQLLFRRVADWLKPDGIFFAHVFAHRRVGYPFDATRSNSWLARNFFTGGVMPSHDLFLHFQRDLLVEDRWWLDGTHYARTANAWLNRLDFHREAVTALFAATDPGSARERVVAWRLFFLACAELFDLDAGSQYGVSHYRMRRV